MYLAGRASIGNLDPYALALQDLGRTGDMLAYTQITELGTHSWH